MIKICIAIIITVLLLVISLLRSVYDNYMYGFWTADDDDFCEKSGIDSMMIYIGEAERGWVTSCTSRACYIIIMNDLCNQGFKITYKLPIICGAIYTIDAAVEFDEEKIWSDNVRITIDMRNGTMKIFDDSTLYARLVKHHDTTNLIKTLEGAEFIE